MYREYNSFYDFKSKRKTKKFQFLVSIFKIVSSVCMKNVVFSERTSYCWLSGDKCWARVAGIMKSSRPIVLFPGVSLENLYPSSISLQSELMLSLLVSALQCCMVGKTGRQMFLTFSYFNGMTVSLTDEYAE